MYIKHKDHTLENLKNSFLSYFILPATSVVNKGNFQSLDSTRINAIVQISVCKVFYKLILIL